MKKVLLLLFIFSSYFVLADEGMWIPILLEKYNIEDMQKKGFKLSAEDIYSINKVSMKDGIVLFGGGCTGGLISKDGLLITNHHCGYGQVQSHSSLDHDYLTDGFWAKSREEELVNAGLTVTFLIRMEDVTVEVLKGVFDNMTIAERTKIIRQNTEEIIKNATQNTHYKGSIENFYNGNQYFLFINEVFKDIRLVAAPPSAIGKFGGDTDNWMWPRHTGDFSLFRVYTAPNGSPAEYAKENIPLKSKYFFKISLKGVEENDFTMVFGYPARTTEYLPSFAVEQIVNIINPNVIAIRDKKLDIIKTAMNSDRQIRIQYSSKAASIANGWKKWIGESKGLINANAIEKKKEFEKNFQIWANSTPELKQKYGNILNEYEKLYTENNENRKLAIYISEAGLGANAVAFANKICFGDRISISNFPTSEQLQKTADSFYKNYDEKTDKKLFAAMLKIYRENVNAMTYSSVYNQFDKITKNIKEDEKYTYFTDYVYNKSFFSNKENFQKLIDKDYYLRDKNKLTEDPILNFANGMDASLHLVQEKMKDFNIKIDSLNRLYMQAQIEFQKDKYLYPDANFTLRVTYGKIKAFEPADGISYKHYTTLDGIMEKDNPEIYDYKVPTRLKELYKSKDYGKYADKNGKMNVCFIAMNHTSGGNSGSPVLNNNGELIGINFDRNWEGTMSDVMYDPSICRNISLDIRYVLFIIDKFANATNLIEELDIRLE